MKTTELRAMSADEMKRKIAELRDTVFDLKMKLKTGRLDSTASLQDAKRNLARVLTVLREQELGIDRAAASK